GNGGPRVGEFLVLPQPLEEREHDHVQRDQYVIDNRHNPTIGVVGGNWHYHGMSSVAPGWPAGAAFSQPNDPRHAGQVNGAVPATWAIFHATWPELSRAAADRFLTSVISAQIR